MTAFIYMLTELVTYSDIILLKYPDYGYLI
jgi:hypothetical protein